MSRLTKNAEDLMFIQKENIYTIHTLDQNIAILPITNEDTLKRQKLEHILQESFIKAFK